MAATPSPPIGWRPGKAGAYERVLIGSGGTQTDGRVHWLLYALGTHVIVELWDGDRLVVSRSLNCHEFTYRVADDAEYAIAFGYDFVKGTISLGVSARGGGTFARFKSWSVPETIGMGLDTDNVQVGGMSVSDMATNTAQWRTAWGYLKPIRGAFASEKPLTRGYLAELMQGV